MDPITLAMMGGTAISSILGGGAAADANAQNAYIGMLNYQEQIAARLRAEAEARRQRGEAHLGQTDASGNRTYFVPGQGWVTELTEDQQSIQDASEAEMLRQLTTEATRNEKVSDRADTRRDREDVLATEGERAFRAEQIGRAHV